MRVEHGVMVTRASELFRVERDGQRIASGYRTASG